MEPKSVLVSTTTWAAVVAFVGAVAPALGFDFGLGASEDITQAVGATAAAGAAVWVVVERWRRGDLFIRRPKP